MVFSFGKKAGDHVIDQELIDLLAVMDINFTGPKKIGTQVTKMCHSLNVEDCATAYRLSAIKLLFVDTDFVSKALGGDYARGYDLILVGAFCSDPKNLAGLNTTTLTKSALVDIVTKVDRKTTVQKKWTVRDLPVFSGKDDEWLDWKEKALATFCLCGLFQIVTDPLIAQSNPEMNCAVHGMLTLCVCDTKCGLDHTVLDIARDGHQAWSNIEQHYEQGPLLKLLITEHHNKIDTLSLSENGTVLDFANAFLRVKNRLVKLHSKATQMLVKVSIHQPDPEEWKDMFLDGIHVEYLSAISQSCRDDDNLTLRDTMTKLRELESQNKGSRKGISQKRQKKDYVPEKPAAHTPTNPGRAPHEDRGAAAKQFTQKLLDKAANTGDAAQKKLLTDFISTNTQALYQNSGQKRNRNQKKGKRRRAANAEAAATPNEVNDGYASFLRG
jgi:hypothetical protein